MTSDNGSQPTTEPRKKYIVFRASVIELTEREPGFWYDAQDTLYALRDPSSSKDDFEGCGFGMAHLPDWPFFQKINDACKPHDYMYSTPVFQVFHTRSYADFYLARLQSLGGHPRLGELMAQLANEFGPELWENEKTRDL